MKTLELLKEEYAILFCQYPSWEELLNDIPHHDIENHTDEVAKLFAKEVAKEALKNASEKSQLMMYYIDEEDTTNVDILNFKHRRIQSCYAVPKQSILNESNIPEL